VMKCYFIGVGVGFLLHEHMDHLIVAIHILQTKNPIYFFLNQTGLYRKYSYG
jgi:hypothetical protein